jgi:hypothetical protein
MHSGINYWKESNFGQPLKADTISDLSPIHVMPRGVAISLGASNVNYIQHLYKKYRLLST